MDAAPQPSLFPHTVRWFKLADRFLLFLAHQPAWALFLTISLTLGLYGFGSYPAQDYFYIAQQPFQLYPLAPHFQDSLLLPLSAFWLGLTKSQAAFEIYTAIAFLLTFGVVFYFVRRSSPIAAVLAAFTLALSPASLTCLLWLGVPDQFTVLFAALLAFATWPPLLFLVTFLGVTNHPLFLFVALSLAGLRFFANPKAFNWRSVLAILLGAFSGYGAVRAFLAYYQLQGGATRLGLLLQPDLAERLLVKAIEAPLSLFSLYNGLWFLLAACLIYGFPKRKLYYSLFLMLQFGAALLTLFVIDTTRIFSLLTIGMLLHCLVFTYQLAVEHRQEVPFRWLLLVLLLVTLFLPHYLVWSGELLYPSAYKFPGLVFNLLFER